MFSYYMCTNDLHLFLSKTRCVSLMLWSLSVATAAAVTIFYRSDVKALKAGWYAVLLFNTDNPFHWWGPNLFTFVGHCWFLYMDLNFLTGTYLIILSEWWTVAAAYEMLLTVYFVTVHLLSVIVVSVAIICRVLPPFCFACLAVHSVPNSSIGQSKSSACDEQPDCPAGEYSYYVESGYERSGSPTVCFNGH